jgi:hypothetical protein
VHDKVGPEKYTRSLAVDASKIYLSCIGKEVADALQTTF